MCTLLAYYCGVINAEWGAINAEYDNCRIRRLLRNLFGVLLHQTKLIPTIIAPNQTETSASVSIRYTNDTAFAQLTGFPRGK